MTERWWSLPADHVRIALTLVAMADGDRVVTTYDHLAIRCLVPRTSVRRALESLAVAGFCTFQSRTGRGGDTVIDLSRPGYLQVTGSSGVIAQNTGSADLLEDQPRTVSSGESGPFTTRTQVHETLCESVAVLADRGGFTDLLGGSNPDLFVRKSAFSRARDQDLLRSDLDQKISRSGDLRRSEEKMSEHSVDETDPPESMTDPARPPSEQDDDPPPNKKRRRIDVGRIPDRAWAAADYLRAQVIGEDGAAFVGTRPWDSAVKTGLRADWADSFRKLHGQTLKALRNVDPAKTDPDAWVEIARTVYWLFHSQPPGRAFVVQSPTSLREKWDRIQACRRNGAAEPARGADRRPDPQAQREFKRLGDS